MNLTILDKGLIKEGEKIGVAVSGGMDSMSLLHMLLKLKEQYLFDLMVVHVDHSIRSNSGEDAAFVVDFCKQNNIKSNIFKVDAVAYSLANKIGIEESARILRYGIFDALLKKHIVDKIALAHHKNDQAETILMNLFRGAGVNGATAMEKYRQDGYIRPLLNNTRQEIFDYAKQNNILYVTDQTNDDTTYARNFLRHQILPLIEKKWPQAVNALSNFAQDCAVDDDYIQKHVVMDAVLVDQNIAKIPTSYFLEHDSIVGRIVFSTLKQIGISKDIERKHITLIKQLAQNGQNGSKISLPFDLKVIKEYDYITFVNKYVQPSSLSLAFKLGTFAVEGFGKFRVTRAKLDKFEKTNKNLLLDGDKVPKDAVWRFRHDGDMFVKFGGGTKKLKSYLADKKIPSRLRQVLPVLAKDNQILVILGVEISQQVCVDDATKHPIEITVF